MRKAALLAIAAGLVSLLPAAPSGAVTRSCAVPPPNAARLTIKALKIVNRPIRGYGKDGCGLAYGAVWDPFRPARPGSGETMVIDAHDVTPVPGYDTHGAHGPFYHLIRIQPGYMAKIKWNGVVRRYRFVGHPFARRQCLSKRVNDKPERLDGQLMCVANDTPIKNYDTEVVYFRCCWPRYTREKFLYVRAVLVQPTT
jgi:hypothetical protein